MGIEESADQPNKTCTSGPIGILNCCRPKEHKEPRHILEGILMSALIAIEELFSGLLFRIDLVSIDYLLIEQ